MEEKKSEKISRSRRNMIKKVGVASVFAAPTLVTFKVSELHAQSSRAYEKASDNARFKR